MIKIGKIVNTVGLKGEVKILSNSDFKDIRFKKGNKLIINIKNDVLNLYVDTYRVYKNFDILTFKGYSNLESVLKFKNNYIYAEKLDHKLLNNNEYFFCDLMNLDVFDIEYNKKIGIVNEIIDNGAQMLIRIKNKDNNTFLIPYVDEFIIKIDLTNNLLFVKSIEGLL